MKRTSSKDLLFIFLLASVTAIFTQTQALNVFTRDIILFILIFVSSGYSLICVLYPEEDYKLLLKKPVLILELSVLITIIISIMLKYFSLGLKFTNLTLILSFIAISLSVTAYILRLNHLKNLRENEKLDKYIKQHSTGTTTKNLIIFTSLSLIMIICVSVTPLNKTPLWMVPGSLFICLIPGYLFFAALFPKNDQLELIERLTLSFGLSMVITSLIGLTFNYALKNIYLKVTLIFLAVFSLIFSLIAFWRMRKLTVAKQLHIPQLEKLLSMFIIVCILLTICTASYTLLEPINIEKGGNENNFTDFYIKEIDSNVNGHTLNLTSGEKTSLTMVLINQEGSTINYGLLVRVNGTILKQDNISLQNNQKMEIPLNFTAGIPGDRNMEFLIYKSNTQNPYLTRVLKLRIT